MRKIYLILLMSIYGSGLLAQTQPMVKKLNEHLSSSIKPSENNYSQKNSEEIDFYEKAYQGVNSPKSSVTDSEGNTYITGTSSDINAPQGNMFTVKYNAEGVMVWEKREATVDFAVEIGFAVTLDENNNPVVTGIQWNGENMDIRTAKYNKSTGETIWVSTFDGGHEGLDYPQAITLDHENNVIVGGMSYSINSDGAEGVGYVTIKYDSDGELVWSAIDENDIENVWIEPYRVAADNQGNIAITGYGSDEDFYKVYYTIKYSPDGTVLWKNKYMYEEDGNKTNSTPSDVKFDEEGNCFVTGTFSDGSGASLMGTIKYSADGEILWIKDYQTPDHITLGYQLEVDDNVVYVAGLHRNYEPLSGSILASYSAENGTENWVRESSNLQIYGDAIGNYVHLRINDSLPVVSIWGQNDTDNVVQIRKYNTDGTMVYEKNYTKEIMSTYSMWGLIGLGVDNNNSIYISLSPRYTDLGEVYELVKFEEDNNTWSWDELYDNMGGGNIRLIKAMPGINGTMAAIGYNSYVDGEFLKQNFFVLNYNADGEIAWEKNYSPEEGYNANRVSMNIDEEGNIYTLLTPNPFDLETFITIQKISPSGEVLWETQKELIYPESYIEPLMDTNGNVYIAGSAHESQDVYQPLFNVIKFNEQGEEQWNRYITANENDNLYFINGGKVDTSGNVIFTGHSGIGSFFSQSTNVSLFQLSPSGDLNWSRSFSVAGWNSGATDIYVDAGNQIYISGWKENQTNINLGEMIALKYNSEGELIWDKSYSEPGRRIRSYDIKPTSDGIVITGFSNHISTFTNRVIGVKYNSNGDLIWNTSSTDFKYYRDFHIDDLDNVYILNQEYSTAHPHRIYYSLSAFTSAKVMKISADGNNVEEETFIGDELSPLDPVNLIPFENGKLLIGTELTNELDHFSGIKFFETTHEVLGSNDQSDELSGNWLGQNYPNPSVNITAIPFKITQPGNVKIILLDMQGRAIKILTDQYYTAGKHTIQTNLSGIPKGIYFYQLKSSSGFAKTLKLIVR